MTPEALMIKKTVIARWESIGRKYWCELYRELIDGFSPSYSYRTDSGGGFQGSRELELEGLEATDAKAIAAFAAISLPFQFPSKYKRIQ